MSTADPGGPAAPRPGSGPVARGGSGAGPAAPRSGGQVARGGSSAGPAAPRSDAGGPAAEGVPDTKRLAAESLAAGDPTGWFERLYAEAVAGAAEVPWDVSAPSRYLSAWAERRGLDGRGRSALVVGCGLGRDAEYLAGLGFAVTAFDISGTAVRTARERHPGSPVTYVVADLLDPPVAWRGRFDLVVESNNVQALPADVRAHAIANVGPLVAPGGTLLVLAAAATGSDDGPPWPLTRAEIDSFGLVPVSVERLNDPADPLHARWRAEFTANR